MAETSSDRARRAAPHRPLEAVWTDTPREDARLGLAGSILLHLAFVLALTQVVPPRLPAESLDRGIEVELTAAPPSPARATAPETATAPGPTPIPGGEAARPLPQAAPPLSVPTPPRPDARSEAAAPTDDGMIRAEHLFSAARLAEPRNRQAREAMRRFAPEERITQLCNLEAMEQIHARTSAGAPQTVIADALGEAKRSSFAIDASNAAVLSAGRWLRLAFRCEVSPDLGRVTAFAFRLGDEVSRADRRRHELPTDGGDMD